MDVKNEFQKIEKKNTYKNYFIGDLNLDINKKAHTKQRKKIYNLIKKLMIINDLKIIKPIIKCSEKNCNLKNNTFFKNSKNGINKSCIDYVLTNNENKRRMTETVYNLHQLQFNSDHIPIKLSIKLDLNKYKYNKKKCYIQVNEKNIQNAKEMMISMKESINDDIEKILMQQDLRNKDKLNMLENYIRSIYLWIGFKSKLTELKQLKQKFIMSNKKKKNKIDQILEEIHQNIIQIEKNSDKNIQKQLKNKNKTLKIQLKNKQEEIEKKKKIKELKELQDIMVKTKNMKLIYKKLCKKNK